jgi:hypothetical protein
MHTTAYAAAATLLSVAACSSSDIAKPVGIRLHPDAAAVSAAKTTTLTSTWEVPLAAAGLSVQSDGRFPDGSGTYSVYAPGVCTFASTMFTTGSGDDTFGFSYPRSGKCGRTWTVTYPGGFTETLAYGGGLQELENSVFSIPIGQTARRHFRFATGTNPSGNPVPGRCAQGLVFGPNGKFPTPGSDSVVVHRLDASTWDVHSQPAPNDHAYCLDNNQLYEMQVAFRIISSQPLP